MNVFFSSKNWYKVCSYGVATRLDTVLWESLKMYEQDITAHLITGGCFLWFFSVWKNVNLHCLSQNGNILRPVCHPVLSFSPMYSSASPVPANCVWSKIHFTLKNTCTRCIALGWDGKWRYKGNGLCHGQLTPELGFVRCERVVCSIYIHMRCASFGL